MPEIGEPVDCAKRQLTWFWCDPRTVWIETPGRSAAQVAGEIMRYLEEHS